MRSESTKHKWDLMVQHFLKMVFNFKNNLLMNENVRYAHYLFFNQAKCLSTPTSVKIIKCCN